MVDSKQLEVLPGPDRCRTIRVRAGISVSEFASAISVNSSTVYLWESGERRPTGLHRRAYGIALKGLADQLGETLLGAEDE